MNRGPKRTIIRNHPSQNCLPKSRRLATGVWLSTPAAVMATLAFVAMQRPIFAQDVPVRAQDASNSPEEPLQEIQVTASAISISGYEAPTPVTSIGVDQLQREARTDIADVLRALPQVTGPSSQNTRSATNISTNLGGVDLINLRNLGINRTLVLFDGQRVVQVSNQGGVDLGMVPATLVERIDTVTGGASATWGSDAVSGVVNLIINKKFEGVQINLQESNNFRNVHRQDKAEMAFGTSFAGDRGHVEVAGSYWNVPEPSFASDVKGYDSGLLVSNPQCTNYKTINATCPAGQYIWQRASGVIYARGTTGGLITGGLNGASSPLTNLAFGSGGQTYTFDPGNVTENIFSNGGTPNKSISSLSMTGTPLRGVTGFGLVSFDITDALRASLQLNYGNTALTSFATPDTQLAAVPIYSGNPYIPASLQSQMTALGLPGFTLGTLNLNNNDGGGHSVAGFMKTLGANVAKYNRTLKRFVFTLDGSIGSNWTWTGYVMHGESHLFEFTTNNVDVPNLKQAENAVLVTPAIHAAVPGLALGSVTCAANVPLDLLPGGASGIVAQNAIFAGATPGCQPLNVMGLNVASQEAFNYIKGAATGANDTYISTLKETVAAVSTQGQLPFGLAAGPVAAAAGVQYRKESMGATNCGTACDHAYFRVGNFSSFDGSYDIKEVNAELNAPILKDQIVQSLSFDLASRLSDYSTSGSVETYKFGVVSQLNDWVRFRGSYSYDIRAPDLYELFNRLNALSTVFLDPRTGSGVSGYIVTTGNQSLKPEKAATRTFGFVLTPLPGFSTSLDYYSVHIKDAISQGYPYTVSIAQCQAGVALFCENLMYGNFPNGCRGDTINACPGQLLTAVYATPLNADQETMSGIDFNSDYRFPILGGAVALHAAVNYTFADRYVSLGKSSDSLNSLGTEEANYDPAHGLGGGGTPKLHGVFGATYSEEGWIGTLQARLIGAAWNVSQWVNTNYLSNEVNRIPAYWYVDARLSHQWDNGLQLYGAVDNIANKAEPLIPGTPNNSSPYAAPYRDDVYDGFGRVWRLGVRLRL